MAKRVIVNIILIFCLCAIAANAQEINEQEPFEGADMQYYTTDRYLNMAPESPQSKGFSEMGNIGVNNAKGSPQISIPLYSISVDDIVIPITLDYDPSGVRVDATASTVGLNWNLSVGGLVSRSVVDKPDKFGNRAWINGSDDSSYDNYLQFLNPSDLWFWYNYETSYDDVEAIDTRPDDFRYNFLNFSNSFKIKPNGDVLKGESDNIDLQVEQNTNNTGLKFVANDIAGNTFYFGESLASIENKNSNNRLLKYNGSGGETPGIYENDYENAETAWYIDKIHTKNEEEVNFTYIKDYMYTLDLLHASQKVEFLPGCSDLPAGAPGFKCDTTGSSSYTYPYETGVWVKEKSTTPLLQTIESKSVKITFNYIDTDILPNGKRIVGWSKRLTEIIIEDKILHDKRGFGFVYDVFSGDHRLKLTEVFEKSIGKNTYLPPYRMIYNETIPLPEVGSKSKDIHGYFNNNNANWLYPLTERTIQDVKDLYIRKKLADRHFNANVLDAGILTELHYPTGGYTSFEFEPNAIGANIDDPKFKEKKVNIKIDSPSNLEKRKLEGFLYSSYVKSKYLKLDELSKKMIMTISMDCPSCAPNNLEIPRLSIYKYNGNTAQAINYSNLGELIYATTLSINGERIISVNEALSHTEDYVAVLSIPDDVGLPPQPVANSINLFLSYYMKERDIKGVRFHPYYLGGLRIKSIKDVDENSSYHVTKYKYNNFSPYKATYVPESYFRSVNGIKTLNSEQMPKLDKTPLYTGFCYTEVEKMIYDNSIYRGKSVSYYEPKYHFNSVIGGNLSSEKIFDSSSKLVSVQDREIEKTIAESFSFLTPSFFDKIYIYPIDIDEPPFSIGTVFYDSSFYGEVPVYTTDYITYEYEERKFLTKKVRNTQINYEGNSPKSISTIKEITYNNLLLPSKVKTNIAYSSQVINNSEITYTYDPVFENVIPSVENTYVFDYPSNSSLSTLPKGLLISSNKFKGNTKTQGSYYRYDSFGNLKEIYDYHKGKASKPSSSPSYIPENYELMTTIMYDSGKPVEVLRNEYTSSQQNRTTYIWGYKDQFVVAKIEGVSYGAIGSNLISSIKSASLQSASSLNTALEALKSSLSDTPITTYLYQPLFGVNQIIYPNNLAEDYKYDSYGRLIRIKDHNGNILNEFKYNYKETW